MGAMGRLTFQSLWENWTWRQLRGCPGRFVLVTSGRRIPLTDLVGDAEVRRHRTPGARDPVLVAVFEDGGIIAYERADGSCVVTLNTADGLARKLRQLGLDLLGG